MGPYLKCNGNTEITRTEWVSMSADAFPLAAHDYSSNGEQMRPPDVDIREVVDALGVAIERFRRMAGDRAADDAPRQGIAM